MSLSAKLLFALLDFFMHNARYNAVKKFFYRLLEDSSFYYKRLFDAFIIALIFTSIFMLIFGVKNELRPVFELINFYLISAIFLVEYLLRLWVNINFTDSIDEYITKMTILHKPISLLYILHLFMKPIFLYMIKPSAIIDLLAIIPFFHELRLFRLFIIFRLFKLFNYINSLKLFASVIQSRRVEFITLFVSVLILLFIMSVMMYVLEANVEHSQINTLFEALYWAVVTISTVGYGDFAPATTIGRFFTMFVIFAGIGIFSMTTSIIVSAMSEQFTKMREEKNIESIKRKKSYLLMCGASDIAFDVIKRLKGQQIILLDADEKKLTRFEPYAHTFAFDPSLEESYERLHLSKERQIEQAVLLFDDDVQTVYTALTLRYLFSSCTIIALLNNSANRKKFALSGVTQSFYKQHIMALLTKEYLAQTTSFEAIYGMNMHNAEVTLFEIELTQYMIRYLQAINIKQQYHDMMVILGYFDATALHAFTYNPQDLSSLEAGDVLIVLGNRYSIDDLIIKLNRA